MGALGYTATISVESYELWRLETKDSGLCSNSRGPTRIIAFMALIVKRDKVKDNADFNRLSDTRPANPELKKEQAATLKDVKHNLWFCFKRFEGFASRLNSFLFFGDLF